MKITNLNFQYPKSDRKIFENFNWELDCQKIHFVIGENGSGKTTFYEIITGMLDYDGVILDPIQPEDILLHLQGVPMLKTLKGKYLAELILGGDGEYSEITLENVQKNLSEKSYKKIQYLWNSDYGNMSVGERRWLIVYLFSLLDRELYIFDEPTAGLDVNSAKEILYLINKLSTDKRKKVLLTTHRLEEIDYFSDYSLTIISNGANYFTGNKSEFEALLCEVKSSNLNEIIKNI